MPKAVRRRRRPPPPRRTPSLLIVGPNVLDLILCFLPLWDKVLHLSHLEHRFPTLRPYHFIHDTVQLSRRIIAALYSSLGLVHLLSQTRAVLVSTKALQDATQGALTMFMLHSDGSSLYFRSMQKLTFHLCAVHCIDRGELRRMMDRIFESGLPFAHLHTLEFYRYREGEGVARFALSPLLNLTALRRLKLQGFELAVVTLSMLCSLRVEELDLSGSFVEPLNVEKEEPSDHLVRNKVLAPSHTQVHSGLRPSHVTPAVEDRRLIF